MNIPSAHSPRASEAPEHVGRWTSQEDFWRFVWSLLAGLCWFYLHYSAAILQPRPSTSADLHPRACKVWRGSWAPKPWIRAPRWSLPWVCIKDKTLCLSSFKAPQRKLFRNGPNLSPSTARSQDFSGSSLTPAHCPHSCKPQFQGAGTFQPELEITISPSEMGQPVNSTSRNTLSSECKGLGVYYYYFLDTTVKILTFSNLASCKCGSKWLQRWLVLFWDISSSNWIAKPCKARHRLKWGFVSTSSCLLKHPAACYLALTEKQFNTLTWGQGAEMEQKNGKMLFGTKFKKHNNAYGI